MVGKGFTVRVICCAPVLIFFRGVYLSEEDTFSFESKTLAIEVQHSRIEIESFLGVAVFLCVLFVIHQCFLSVVFAFRLSCLE